MGFLALILALLLEQLQPLARRHPVRRGVTEAVDWIRRHTDAGESRQGLWGWLLVVVGAGVGVWLLDLLLARVHPVLSFALHVLLLYLTTGFRQFSHWFTRIQLALAAGDADGARDTLDDWLRESDPDRTPVPLSVSEVCRQAIAHAIMNAHRHVFGPLVWYVLLPGPAGPVVYRLAELLARRWGGAAQSDERVGPLGAEVLAGDGYGRFARRAFPLVDWLPLRVTAAAFAVVGNFEDAVYCWRGASTVSPEHRQRSVLLGAGGGALGLHLADPALEADWAASPGGFDWSGAQADPASLRSAVGLVWRAVVLVVLVFALLSVAHWLG